MLTDVFKAKGIFSLRSQCDNASFYMKYLRRSQESRIPDDWLGAELVPSDEEGPCRKWEGHMS